MTRPFFAALVLAIAVATAVDARQTAQQQPVFRSTVDVVTVDVSVRTIGRPVGGLTANDFVLLDNGVRQTIESVEMQEVPVDVSVLVDANEDVTIGLDSIHEQVRRIASRLRPADRIRVTAINGGVADILPARAPALQTMPPIEPRGVSAASDGIAAALLRGAESGRRHLIVAVTNGVDAISTIAPETVIALARQSEAVLHIVQLDVVLELATQPPSYSTGRTRLNAARRQISGLRPPTRLFWRPYDSIRDIETLRAAADATGGALHLPGLITDTSDVVTKVFEDYRRSYVLRYTPKGVAREGWHEIVVTVPKYPSYTLHARRGYGVEAAPRPRGREEKPSDRPQFPGRVSTLVEAYDRADYARMEKVLAGVADATLVADVRKAGNPWPANPNREAVFVIEIAEAALRSRREAAIEAARDLLVDHRKLVRHPLGPDRFERYWLWAVLAMLQGVNHPQITREFADYALSRFSDEPRFVLARAFAADQSRALEDAEGRGGAGEASHVTETTSRYDTAARFPETAAEARVRKAFFLHRIDRHRDALAALDAVEAGPAEPDPIIQYFRSLFRGRVLEALEQFEEAKAAYQDALEVLPGTQSPRVALMRLAVRAGDRPAAEALAAAIQNAAQERFDPWWVYWLGDYRHYDAIIGRMRESTR
ncbi:MAG: hypothetical protein WD690_08495 [Vicinamibacterales bacterium]